MISFKAELSVNSFKNLQKEIKDYNSRLKDSVIYINEALAARAYDLVIQYVPVDTGALMDSIVQEITSEFAKIYTDKEYALFVEFGTGIRGKSSPHPQQSKEGWTYGENYTGQKASKYMWNTYLDMEKEMKSIAEKVLQERGLL